MYLKRWDELTGHEKKAVMWFKGLEWKVPPRFISIHNLHLIVEAYESEASDE